MVEVIRDLGRDEIERLWTIDRSELIENVYYLEDGRLVLKQEHWELTGWPAEDPERYTPVLLACYDRGGVFYGAFEDSELVGAAVLESKFIGKGENQLQLKFLHVSQSYRKRGLGRVLFERALDRARDMGAHRLYISATPSENTVAFYQHLGCEVAEETDPELFEFEPEDIHLEYVIPQYHQRK